MVFRAHSVTFEPKYGPKYVASDTVWPRSGPKSGAWIIFWKPMILGYTKWTFFSVFFSKFRGFFFNVEGSNFFDFQYFPMKPSQKCGNASNLSFLGILVYDNFLAFMYVSDIWKQNPKKKKIQKNLKKNCFPKKMKKKKLFFEQTFFDPKNHFKRVFSTFWKKKLFWKFWLKKFFRTFFSRFFLVDISRACSERLIANGEFWWFLHQISQEPELPCAKLVGGERIIKKY